MPARRKHTPYAFVCQRLDGGRRCGRPFRNRSGYTQHINSAHRHLPSRSGSPASSTAGPGSQPEDNNDSLDELWNHPFDDDPMGVSLSDDPMNAPFDNVPSDDNDSDYDYENLDESDDEIPDHRPYEFEDDVEVHHIVHPILDGTSLSITSQDMSHSQSTGTPCNEHGVDLPPNTLPPICDPRPKDFSPYEDRPDFELADLLFRRNQMSGGQIDELMDLWAAKGRDPPFANHKDIYDTIDSTPLGDAPWKSFSVSYAGPMPDEDIPLWMLDEFEVWHRDPRVVIQHQLANPDFVDGIHYAPYQEFGADGERRWQDLMSANWPWKQAVCNINISLYIN
jgi:Plavaka transposase